MYKILFFSLCVVILPACETAGGTKNSGDVTIEELDRWRAIADAAYTSRQYVRALNHYKKLSEAIPNDVDIWFRLGNTYNRLNDTENAIASYKEVLVRDSQHSKAWYNTSMAQLKKAAQTFQEASLNLSFEDPVYQASRKLSKDLLELIDHSNRTVYQGYTKDMKQPVAVDDVEVIILKEKSTSGDGAESKAPNRQ